VRQFGAVLILLCFGLAHAQDKWINLVTSKDGQQIYYGLAGSYEVSQNKAGEEIVVMTTKVKDEREGTVRLEKIYVRTLHCLKNQGKAVRLDLDGKFKGEFDFIFDAGTVGTYQAQFLCEIWLNDLKEKAGKGI